ncbi:MAG: hypothetical protein ACTSSP_06350 [Candidatus Asgardarchaeia archaeon]
MITDNQKYSLLQQLGNKKESTTAIRKALEGHEDMATVRQSLREVEYFLVKSIHELKLIEKIEKKEEITHIDVKA